jgi:hypothetical protein
MKPHQDKRSLLSVIVAVLLVCSMSSQCIAQVLSGPRSGGRGSERLITEPGPASRAGVPEWNVDDNFSDDIFTFVRIMYSSNRGWGGRGGGSWRTDFPNADLNFSYRLEQLTSMIVDPDAGTLDLLDDKLYDYPFIFIIDPRSLSFRDNEAKALKRYLLNGGFLMVDDFWGTTMKRHFFEELEKVFPDKTPISLELTHPIFNAVFPLSIKPQVPSEDSAERNKGRGVYETYEDEILQRYGEGPAPADYLAILDDNERIMVLICHNTDLSDGWEEEGKSQWFFSRFSESLSYPMGINIVYYALTH